MKKILMFAATATVALMGAAQASAAPYLFIYQTNPAGRAPVTASFTLDSSPTSPTVGAKGFFSIANVAGTYSTGVTSATVDFFLSDSVAQAGGLELDAPNGGNVFAANFGAQLFTGTLANPTFVLGNYALSNSATLSITAAPSAAVPEPAGWAMMILGFGAVGTARRRRQKVTLRYA